MKLDALSVETMASEHLCLNLSERLNWEDFPQFAEDLMSEVGGEILDRGDAHDIRLWKVDINGCVLSLVFDDFPVMTSLESQDVEGDAVITEVYDRLAKQ